MSVCPHPDKAAWSSERAAKRALRALRHPQGAMHTYRCCGHWHLGHGDYVDTGRPPGFERPKHRPHHPKRRRTR